MKRRLLNWLYRWVDRRGNDRIPWWVRRIYKRAHWCPEMDGLLIIDNPEDCFCGICPNKFDMTFHEEHELGHKPDDVIVDLDFEGFKDDLPF